MLLRGYLDGTDPKDADGWLATGDLGRFDDRFVGALHRNLTFLYLDFKNVIPVFVTYRDRLAIIIHRHHQSLLCANDL